MWWKPALVTEGHRSGMVDPVVSNPVAVGLDATTPKPGLRAGRECLQRSAPLDGPVGPDLVVVGDETVDLVLERPCGRRLRLLVQELLNRLVKALDLAAGLRRMVGPRVLELDAERQEVSMAAIPLRYEAVKMAPLALKTEAGRPPGLGRSGEGLHNVSRRRYPYTLEATHSLEWWSMKFRSSTWRPSAR